MTVGLSGRVRDAKRSHSLSAAARLLSWVTLLYFAGFYFFTNGFLLTRLRLENTSSCEAVPGTEPHDNRSSDAPGGTPPHPHLHPRRAAGGGGGGGGGASCWYPARFKKVVVLLIDALRFDFTAYDEGGVPDASAERFRNRLKTMHRKLREEPRNSLLFQSIADPPTTTLQRLMGITTGTLPTFVDAGSNFAGQALGEDNIIDQLAALGRRMAFLGDDTWLALYPDAFRIKHAYPSFDVWDLHSVDDGVLKHLFPLLDRPGDWDVLIAHFLGVDHCGHRYGPDHPAMQEKLEQMDEAISRVLRQVNEDTLLVVLGDHGMDGKGDHGGDSPQEVETGLFMYSKTPIVSHEEARVAAGDGPSGTTPVRRMLRRADEQAGWESNTPQLGGHRTVSQIDLLPTLSLLLGAPIPFNNLGSVIPELFTAPPAPHTAFSEIDSGPRALLSALRLNARQTHRYMSEYQASQPRTELAAVYNTQLHPLFAEAEKLSAKAFLAWASSSPGSRENESDEMLAEDAAVAYMVYLRKSLKVSQQVWAQFSPGRMGLGLAVVVVASIVSLCLVREIRDETLNPPEDLLKGVGLGLVLGIMSGLLISATGLCAALGFGAVDVAAIGATAASVLAFLRNLLRTNVTPSKSASSPATSTGLVIRAAAVNRPLCALKSFSRVVIPLLPALLIPASNSLVIHEDKITSFFLQTFGAVQLLRSFTAHTPRTAQRMRLYATVFLVITRLNAAVTICREEQMPGCVPTFYATASSAVPSTLSIACVGALAALAPLALKRVLRDSQNFHGAATMWIDVGLRMVLGLCAAYRLLDVLWETDHREVKVVIVRVAAGVVLVFAAFVWWHQPLPVVTSETKLPVRVRPATGDDGRCDASDSATPKPQMVILGAGNVYGAAYAVFLAMLVSLLAIVMQPVAIMSTSAELAQIIAALEMFDYSRDIDHERAAHRLQPYAGSISSSPSRQNGSAPPALGSAAASAAATTTLRTVTMEQPLVLAFIANQAYFSTGHQATINSIQWNAGLIGLHEADFVVSPVLIALNTFGPHILAACAVPALALWKVSPQDTFGAASALPSSSSSSSPSSSRATSERSTRRRSQPADQILRAALLYLLVTAGASAGASSFWTAWFRRHLMVWKVFAPRWMLAVASAMVGALAVIALAVPVAAARVLDRVQATFRKLVIA